MSISRILDSCNFSPADRALYESTLREYGVVDPKDISLLVDADWDTLKVRPLHRRKILWAFARICTAEGASKD